MPSFEEDLLTQRHQITSLDTRDPRLPYGENPECLSHLGLIRYRVVTLGQTDRQTDRQTGGRTGSQQYLPVQLSRLKSNDTAILNNVSWRPGLYNCSNAQKVACKAKVCTESQLYYHIMRSS